jgi:trans-aconitate methyltransferase
MCGIRINHAYALYIAIKHLQPTTILESGVNAGQSTYFMRKAAPDAKIFAIDPLDEPICGQEKRWVDEKNAMYYTGANFQDIGAIDWGAYIKKGEIDPKKTLVFLDDHLEVFDRLPALMKNGFRHVVLEDNYKAREGATPKDKAGWTPKQMFHRTDDDADFLWNNLVSYAEFPPLVSST